ncbi:hypothetical protein OF83DRAFT_1280620 [Amylostereum chailletii]|nr:hypothetical protein OF83DRAFT_1280620 [Amylostereum chailletii]
MEQLHRQPRPSMDYPFADPNASAANLTAPSTSHGGHDSIESVPVARTTPAGIPVGLALGGEDDAGSGGGGGAGTHGAGAIAGGDRAEGGTAPATLASPVTEGTPFYKKRWFLISQALIALVSIALLFIILYPVIHAIAQHVVDVSELNVDTVAINQPTNGSFTLGINGYVTHTGIFSASIQFPEPIDIFWLNGTDEIHIGRTRFTPLSSKNKLAFINQTTSFDVADEDAFGSFTQSMITTENFTWILRTPNLAVRALKLPLTKGIKFDKKLTLPGINNFDNNVRLLDFQMPSDSPEGGINFVTVTQLNNPSPFQLGLGTVVFNLTYNGVFLGVGTGFNTSITPGLNNITLAGVLVPHNGSDSELAIVSDLFTRYLNFESSPVIAQGLSTLQNDNTTISWLSKGLHALKLNVPFQSPNPINPIQAISIGNFDIAFSEQDMWTPVANTRSVQASMQLPFGFNLEIGEIMNSFSIVKNGTAVAQLSTPLGASTSDIHVLSETNTQGTINITIADTPMIIPDDSRSHFSQFNTDLTDLDQESFQLQGHAHTVANLSLGRITLDPINFNVTSGLSGLQGLRNLVSIDSVDVVGGTSDHINLAIEVSIENPSNLKLGMGDLQLQLSKGAGILGLTIMPNLTLAMGNNNVSTHSTFSPNNSPEGQQTLNDFVGKKDTLIHIAGYDNSTQIAPLLQALKTLQLDVTLPGLTTDLLSSAALEVLPTTGHADNISHVTVALSNPFTAGLDITQIQSTVSARGIQLGTIQTSTNFSASGNSTSTSPNLAFDMNMDPESLFTVTRFLAQEAGLSTQQLDGIVALGGYQYLSTSGNTTTVGRRDNIYTGFNLPSFVDKAFKQLTSDVVLTTGVSIGDYQTTLQYTQNAVPTKTDESLNLILPILAQPIVQKIVAGSALGVSTVLISDVKQNSFGTKLSGSITQSGPFDAIISFGNGLTINWSGKALGSIKMPDINVTGDVGAEFNVDAAFNVSDVDHLTDFTRTLLTEESFEWDITGENLTVSALGISVSGISLPSKKVILKGMNSLKNGVTINSFDLPANDPAGGIHLTLDTSVTNPSQVGIDLSSIAFKNFFGNTNIGPAASNQSFTLAAQSTVPLALVGRLIPQSSQTGLDDVSTIFNRFIHGMDSNVSVYGDSAGPSDVTWLNEGIKSLIISTVLPNQGKLNVIRTINLNELDLRFSEDSAYGPSTSSSDTTASFSIPFDFPVDITALEQNITVGTGGQNFAQLIIPKGPSTTEVEKRIIHLGFSDVPFAVSSDDHSAFQQFLASTTTSANQSLELSGVATADASTAVGLLSLQDIEFAVGTSIAGLQGLNSKPVQLVSDLDVNHGFSDYLLIKVNASLYNPSNITIGAGDVAFGLIFKDKTIGTSDISNILIVPGNGTYAIDVHYSPQGDAVPTGQLLLENYLQGVPSDTTIKGNDHSTPIDSLELALSEIDLSPVTIPAIHQNLIPTAALKFPLDIVQKKLASTTFELDNPFTASINLLVVSATTTHGNLTLGKIDHVDVSSSPIHADGHSNITSPTLPFEFNTDPLTIIELLISGAQTNGVDLGPLVELFAIVVQNPDFHPPIDTSVDTSKPTCVSGKQFDADGAILGALKDLQVTLDVESSVRLDDFPTDLAFKQYNVTAVTDETALYLIGAVAPPIVQTLVTGSNLTFNAANITNISNTGFDLALEGSLTNIGPLDAAISFVEPVTVTWQGHDIAQIELPDLCAAATTGIPNLQTNAHLTITDNDQFTSFATFLLHQPEFTWTISTDKLRVTALGTIFDGVSLTKDVSFKAFNNLPGVTISNFQLPSDDPAGGIHIETDSDIPSPAQLGIDLGTVGFISFFQDALVGPLSGDHLVLAPETTTKTHLSGRIVPQSGDDLNTIGQLFTDYLAGKNQTLKVKGDSVQPSGAGGPVNWLSTAFKTLELDVTLPGQVFTIIESITISDLSVVMTDQGEAFAPLASSQHTLAQYKNPFGFSLQVVQSSQDITLADNGDFAELKLPTSDTVGGVSTGNVADLPITFSNQTLQSLNNDAFSSFFGRVTDTSTVEWELKGSADVVARTTIGDVPIGDIPFNVSTTISGINAFGGTAGLNNVSVVGSGGNGGNEYIRTTLTTTLQNPSNVSLQTNDLSFSVIYKDTKLGRATIDKLDLAPGENVVASEFHYMPDNANDTVAQSFLSDFLQGDDHIPLEVKGDPSSSPYASLLPGLEGISLSTSLQALNSAPIISHVNVFITLESLVTNLVNVNFDVTNPLDAPLVITFSQADSGVDGVTYAQFSQSFDNFVVPPHSTVNSGTFGNVLLTQGALGSLGIIPLGKLDIFAVSTAQVGEGGYAVPWLHLTQPNVPTSYTLDILGVTSLDQLKSMAKTLSASLAGHLSTSTSGASSAASTASAEGSLAQITASVESSTVAASETALPTPKVTSAQPTAAETTASAEDTPATSSAAAVSLPFPSASA